MDFQEAQAEYDRLKAQFESGKITAGEFEEQVFNLVVEDESGVNWQLGVAGGNWYRLEGNTWVAATPPVSVRPETGEEKRPAGSAVGVVARLAMAVRAALAGQRFGMPGWALSGLGLAALLMVATVAIMLTGGLNRQTKPIAAITPSATVDDKVSVPNERTPTLNLIPAGETPTTTTTPLRMTEAITPTIPQSKTSSVWKLVSYSAFNSEDAFQNEWLTLLDYFVDFSYQNYRGRDGVRLNFFESVIDIFSAEEFSEDESADIEVEEIFAFPKAELAGSVEIMCRFMDWDNVYKLSVERSKWTLSAVVDGDERRLGSGTTLDGFQGGDWGRFNLRCFGSQIAAWQNGKLLIRVLDSDLEEGSWAVSLYSDDELAEAEVALFAHRVYRRSQERFGMLEDRVESGDVMLSLERSWRAEGGGYSLRLMVENRGTEAIPLKAENILLESVDGTTFMAEEQPPANRSGTPLSLPLNLQPGALSGDVYFRGFGVSEISRGIDLVLDLKSLGFGVIRFSLPLK